MTEKNWEELFPGSIDPVQGSLSAYDTAATEADNLRRSAQACSDEFTRAADTSSLDEMGGQAADQLLMILGEIDGAFDDLPAVFTDLTSIFDDHGCSLRALKTAAAEALARANTGWVELDAATSAKSNADRLLASIESQIWSLRRYASPDDGAAQAALDHLDERRWRSQQSVDATQATLAGAEVEFQSNRIDHERLRQEEAELINSTIDRIRQIDLEDLRDPNRVLGFVQGVAGWGADLLTDLYRGVGDIVDAALSGDWLDALAFLSDFLDAMLTVLAIVGVALLIFSTGGIAAGLIVGLLVTKLLVDTTLAATQHPHPTTGQPMSWADVIVDVALIGVTTATAGAVGRGSVGSGISGLRGEARRSVFANLQNLRTPLGAAGHRLYGAARSSTIERSQQELAAATIDNSLDWGLGVTLNSFGTSDSITTDPEVWTNPALVEFARQSPMAPGGLVSIDAARAAMARFVTGGPSCRSSTPPFHVIPSTAPLVHESLDRGSS